MRVADAGAAGARRRQERGDRPGRSRGHRARATPCCSSSTTIRTTRASCSGWRATRASRASSPTAVSTALALARRVPADRDHARRLPAGHARLDGAEQPQARSGDAPHPGADPVGRGGAPARPVARRVLLPGEAGDDRGARSARSTASRPTSRRTRKRLLVVEDNDIERESIVELLAHDDIEIAAVGTGARSARRRSTTSAFDCCVVDLRLPDMSGFELLEQLQARAGMRDVPVVVFTGKELSRGGGDAAAGGRQEHRAQGRAVARAAVRRDGAVPAPRRRRPARGKAAAARAAARLERGAARPQGARRRRRRAQHLRADDGAREPGHGSAQRDERPAGDRDRRTRRRISASC